MTFSKRHNFAEEPPITIRNNAPDGLRYAVIVNAYDILDRYEQIRKVVCRTLLTAPDLNNWSDIPNIREEVLSDIDRCEWYKVYDVAEALLAYIEDQHGYDDAVQYANAMNNYFISAGIGWEFKPNEGIVYRGEENFQTATQNASSILVQSGRNNAANEINEAIKDISRRPNPDLTGAIHHAMAAVECTAQDITGSKKTLGKFISELDLPKPLDEALDKLWGFASQHGRHVSKSSKPSTDDAELIVHVSCAICNFLVKKHGQQDKNE